MRGINVFTELDPIRVGSDVIPAASSTPAFNKLPDLILLSALMETDLLRLKMCIWVSLYQQLKA